MNGELLHCSFVYRTLEMEKLKDQTFGILNQDPKKLDNLLINANSEELYSIIKDLESNCLYIKEYEFDFENLDPDEGMPKKEFINFLQTALFEMELFIFYSNISNISYKFLIMERSSKTVRLTTS